MIREVFTILMTHNEPETVSAATFAGDQSKSVFKSFISILSENVTAFALSWCATKNIKTRIM
jgi:hypothetical protein